MAFKHDNGSIDMDQFAEFLKGAVDKVKMEENPDVLNELKKVYKKNVPFSMRGYVAAYLAKLASGNRMNRPRRDFRENNREQFRNREPRSFTRTESVSPRQSFTAEETTDRTPRPHVQIDEALAATIFIGIGRNRRVYPRDLVGLLVGVTGIDRDRIGDIRVLANYSFVQLFAEDADKVITALNGYDYRGRKLSVSYSKQRSNDDAESTSESSGYTPTTESTSYVSSSSSADAPVDNNEDAAAYAAAEKATTNQPFAARSGDEESSSSYLV
jgi:hypothetical protein